MPTGTVVSRGYLAPAAVDGVRGRVTASFPRCAYVTIDGGPMLVLHADGHDHTPTSLCPAIWPPPGSAVAVGDRVVGRAGHLKLGELVLDVRAAREWRPAPARAAPARAAPARAAPAPAATPAAAAATTVADLGAVHRLLLRPADRRTGGLVPALELALARRDLHRATRCVASLVGRGPGLTPSGDDALVGLLAVLHRLAPAGEGSVAAPPHGLGSARQGAAIELLRTAVTAHLHRTADISAHYLRLAVDGHVGERLVALCDALVAAASPGEVETAAATVVATGATSGADALLGVLSGARVVAAAGAISGADALLVAAAADTRAIAA
jgi:hypothetical protein